MFFFFSSLTDQQLRTATRRCAAHVRAPWPFGQRRFTFKTELRVFSGGLPAAYGVITVWICMGRFMSMCAFACVSDPVIDWKEEQWHSCAGTSRWLWKPNPKPSFVLAHRVPGMPNAAAAAASLRRHR